MFWLKFTETNDYTVPVLFMEQNALPVSTSLWIPALIFLSLSCDCSVYMYVIIPKRKKSFFLQHILPFNMTWSCALMLRCTNRSEGLNGKQSKRGRR